MGAVPRPLSPPIGVIASPSWAVQRCGGSVGELLALDDSTPGRVALVFDVDTTALVLGSTQDLATIDIERARAWGVDVVRRRSGGSAVFLAPGAQVWIDLFIDRGDELWTDDVVQAALWAGEAWARALSTMMPGPIEVHSGKATAVDGLGDHVCFGGVGPGEVLVQGRKVVGVSQRRRRDRLRIQTTALLRWQPELMVDLLALEPGARADLVSRLKPMVATLPAAVAGDLVADAVVANLPS